jgi:3-deoxy-D-manno-octulosonic-acid transferase
LVGLAAAMLTLYSLLFYLSTPFILLRLYWRGYKAPAYRKRWQERLGIYQNSHNRRQLIWFHAVSVGEAEAVFPLVKLFQQRHSETTILITTTTPTGSARVKAVFGDTVEHVYLPYDIPWAVQRFTTHFKPCLGVVMETEIWPNLYRQCGTEKIPLYIINARLSDRSTKGYGRIPSLVKPTLTNITKIVTQSKQDTERFLKIGAHIQQLSTAGNIKFDLEIDSEIVVQGQKFKQQVFAGRRVWIIASSHRNEEEIFLQIYKQLKNEFPDLLLVLVPRHPERFSEVKSLVEKHSLRVLMRTAEIPCPVDTDVFIGDTMGELKLFYAASDIAFVGGSMVDIGGHNVLEPAALGVAVLFGPYMSNFRAIEQGLLYANAALQCDDENSIGDAVRRLFTDAEFRQNLVANAKLFVNDNKGAMDTVYALLDQEIAAKKS